MAAHHKGLYITIEHDIIQYITHPSPLTTCSYARATLAEGPFVVNPMFVKFDQTLLNLGQNMQKFFC